MENAMNEELSLSEILQIRRDKLAALQLHDHDGVDRSRMNGRDGALQRVACRKLH